MYIGAINYERNLSTFCRAVELAAGRGMDFKLTIIGGGNERDDLVRLATQSRGLIRVRDPVPYGEIPGCLEQAHVGILPFPDEEKFRVSSAIKLFEYMAAGMPILSTRIAPYTQVLGDCPCVFWAEQGDTEGLLAGLCQVWDQRESLADRGEAALARVADWTWRASACKLSDALLYGLRRAKGYP